MAWNQAEIEALQERVARIAPDKVPREDAIPQLFAQFEDRSGVQAVQAAPVSAPQATAETPSQNNDTLELDEAPLSDAVLSTVIQAPKAQSPANAADTAEPSQSKPMSAPSGDMARMDTKAGGDDEVGKVERDERALDGKLLELSRKADPGDLNDLSVGSGYRSRLVNGQENAKARAKKRGQQDIATSMSVMAMQQRIDDLYADINRWEKENEQYEAQIASWERDNTRDLETIERNKRTMEENRRQIEDINQRIILLEQLRTMRDAGTLDPDNPDHADMLRDAGIDPEEYKKDSQALDAEIEEQEAKKDELKAQNDELQAENYALASDIEARNADIEDARAKIEANKVRIKEARAEITAIEKKLQDDPSLSDEEREALRNQNRELASEKDGLMKENKNLNDRVFIDEEVYSFMKAYAEIEKIEDPMERLRREKELMEGVSEEAKEVLSQEESTKQLFEEDHFKPLEDVAVNAEGPAIKAAAAPSL